MTNWINQRFGINLNDNELISIKDFSLIWNIFEGNVFANKFTISVHVGYGGYTRLNTGLALTYSDKNWFFKLGSNSLQGYIIPKQAYGQGFYFSVAKKFK